MSCLLEMGKKAMTNEEYKKVIQRRMAYNAILIILGLAALGFEIVVRLSKSISLSDYMNGVYTGIGTSFVVVGIMMLVGNYKTLHNEEKLKKERLKNTDERNLYIQSKALQYAGLITLIASYLVMLVAGVYNEVIFHCFYVVVMFFLVLYVIINKVLQKKL